MSLVVAGAYVLSVLVAGVWAGSVVFVTRAVVPLAGSGSLNAAPLERMAASLRGLSRVSAVLFAALGVGLTWQGYTLTTLTETVDGYLVVAMVPLWFALVGLVERGIGHLLAGTSRDKVRDPARRATTALRVGSLVAVLVLVDVGLLAAYGLDLL